MLTLAPETLRNDRYFVMKALGHGFSYADIPQEYKEDQTLLRESLLCDYSRFLYLKLPEELKSEPVLASAALTNRDEETCKNYKEIIAQIHRYSPGVFRDRRAMWEFAAVGQGQYDDASELVFQYCSDDLQADRELIFHFVKANACVYEQLDEPIKSDPELIACVFDSGYGGSIVLKHTPPDAFIANPEFAVRAFHEMGEYFELDKWDAGNVPREVFRMLDVVQAYAEAGGELWSGFPSDYCGNYRVCADFLDGMMFRYGDVTAVTRVFDWMSEDLFRDKSFILEMLNSGLWYFETLMERFQRDLIDYDIILAVFDRCRCFSDPYQTFTSSLIDIGLEEMIPAFSHDVHEKLLTRDAFMLFLFGMSHSTSPDMICHLQMLYKDEDTVKGLGKTIKAYLGLAFGKELEVLRNAWSFEELRHNATH